MQMSSGVLRRTCALVVAALVGTSILVVLPGAAGAIPVSDRFSCAGGEFFRLEDGDLTQTNDPNGTWTSLRTSINVQNAIAYRASDRYIYGTKPNSDHVWKVTASATTDMGAVTGLPTDTYAAAGINQANGRYYVSSGANNLYEVDLEALTASSVSFNSNDFKVGQDLIILDGWVWSVRNTTVYGLDLATGSTKSYSFDVALLQGGTVGGAMWFDESNSTLLMEIRGTGAAVEFAGIGGASITAQNVGFSAPGTGFIDGASCRKTVVTITPDAQSVVLHDAAPVYTFASSGYILGESAASATGYSAPVCTSSYTTSTPKASSPLTITCSGGSADDYVYNTVATANLTIDFSPDSLPCSSARFVRVVNRDLSVSNSLSGGWTTIRSSKPVANAISHRAEDQFLYGFPLASNHLYRIGIAGRTDLGAVANLPSQQYLGADFDPATGLLYVVSKSGSVYKINIDTLTATQFTLISSGGGRQKVGRDIAIAGGKIWSAGTNYIFQADLATGQVTKIIGWTHGGIGAMWVNADGATVSAQVHATGEVYTLADPASSSVYVTTLPTAAQIDGATCR